jgi:hypothetical protein
MVGDPVLATFLAHPYANELNSASHNADLVLQTIYFDLFAARPT